MSKTRVLSLAAATVLGLTLASCSSGDSNDDTGTTDSGTTEQSEATATDEATTEEATTDEAAAGDAAAGGAECLIGTWEMSADAMEEQVLAQLGGEGEVSVDGTSTMTFDGTNVTSTADNTSTYSIEVQGTAIEGSSTTAGSIVVGYTADDTSLTYGDVVSAEGTITSTTAGSTQEQDIADTAALMTGQTQTFTCTDAELTLTSEASGAEFSQTFTRA